MPGNMPVSTCQVILPTPTPTIDKKCIIKPICGIKTAHSCMVLLPCHETPRLVNATSPPPSSWHRSHCLPRPSGTEQLSSSLTRHNTGKSMCTDNCLLITTIPFSLLSLDCFWLLFDLSLLVVALVAFSEFDQPPPAVSKCCLDERRAETKNDRSHARGYFGANCYY